MKRNILNPAIELDRELSFTLTIINFNHNKVIL